MSEELKRERLELNDLSSVAGGVAVDVNSETRCIKPEGSFKILVYKKNGVKKGLRLNVNIAGT